MHRIRLLAAALPPIMYDIVRALAEAEPVLEVVGQVSGEEDLVLAVAQYHADAIMTTADGCSGERVLRLLERHPRLRVLTFTADRRIGYLDRLVPARTVLHDVSADELVHAILGTGRFG